MIIGELTLRRIRVITKVSRVTKNTRIWSATGCTRRGALELIVGLAKRNKMLMSLNWLKGMKISVMLYLLQTDQSVTKIDGLLTLDVHNISIPIRKCSHILRFKGRGLYSEFCYEQGD